MRLFFSSIGFRVLFHYLRTQASVQLRSSLSVVPRFGRCFRKFIPPVFTRVILRIDQPSTRIAQAFVTVHVRRNQHFATFIRYD